MGVRGQRPCRCGGRGTGDAGAARRRAGAAGARGHAAGRCHFGKVPAGRGRPRVLAPVGLSAARSLRGDGGPALCVLSRRGRAGARFPARICDAGGAAVGARRVPARPAAPSGTAATLDRAGLRGGAGGRDGDAGAGLRPAAADDAAGAGVGAGAAGSRYLGAVALVGISPHYPWYLGWLVPLVCVAPSPALLYLVAASVLLTLDPVHHLGIAALVYVPPAGLALWQWVAARRRR